MDEWPTWTLPLDWLVIVDEARKLILNSQTPLFVNDKLNTKKLG